jgi:hypothetical protein
MQLPGGNLQSSHDCGVLLRNLHYSPYNHLYEGHIMKNYLSYFSLDNILSVLIRFRLATAMKRRKYAVLKKVFVSAKDPLDAVPASADEYLPPRRMWRRPGRQDRSKVKAAKDIDEQTLRRTVMPLIENETYKSHTWGLKLNALHAGILARLGQEEVIFQKPAIDIIDNGGKKGRAIASYKDISDRLLLSLTNRYLSNSLDSHFSECSYAFRSDKDKNHTAAIQDLLDYQKRMKGRPLYVAECDIQGFFDTIQHDAVREAFERLCNRHNASGQKPIDTFAVKVVGSYLSSYNFFESIVENPDVNTKPEFKKLHYLTQQDLMARFRQNELGRTGIPQGGALSPLLANCVLDQADRAVLSNHDPDLFYARFCDDMIIVHPRQEACQSALKRFCDALEVLKLPIHPVQAFPEEGKAFFETKSKGPYLWDSIKQGGHPWLSFLGYHVKHDGLLRLRQAALDKHKEKIRKEIRDTIKLAEAEIKIAGVNKVPVRAEKILGVIRRRVIAMGTGLQEQRARSPEQSQVCWRDAFPLLNENEYSIRQMRLLDHHREQQIRRLQKIIMRDYQFEEPTLESEKKRPKIMKFFSGSPYSYHATLRRENENYLGDLRNKAKTFYNER